jgi:hypothetical protein
MFVEVHRGDVSSFPIERFPHDEVYSTYIYVRELPTPYYDSSRELPNPTDAAKRISPLSIE